jgi:secondary thiamine-phosphate synthase enzyme
MHKTITIDTCGQGLYEITTLVQSFLKESLKVTSVNCGLLNIFVQHTSASLTIQENADPSARIDLEAFLRFLVPENHPLFTHTHEGPDDMPAHIKAALTNTNLTIPFADGELGLGTWQGVYLWEHRDRPHSRRIALTFLG